MEKILNFIDNQWIESRAAETIDVINPATGELLARTPLSTKDEVDQAAQAAQAAWWGWRKTPAQDRVQYLFKLKYLMDENIDDISRTITMECGKTFEEVQSRDAPCD